MLGLGPVLHSSLVFIFALIIAQSNGGEAAEKGSKGRDKLLALGKLSAESPNYVIPLNDKTYSYYAVAHPKPYHLVVLYTAPAEYCPQCSSAKKHYYKIAKEFVDSGGHVGTALALPVFFAEIDLSKNEKVLILHAFADVPKLAVLDDKAFQKTAGTDKVAFNEGYLLPYMDTQKREQLMLHFINTRTKREVKLSQSVAFSASLFASLIIGLMTVMLILAQIGVVVKKWPIIVAVGALILQVLSTSGLFFSILNRAALFGVNPYTHQIELFARGQRSQYVVEGLLMAFSTVISGLSFTGIVMCPSLLKKNSKFSRAAVNFSMLVLFVIAVASLKFVRWGHLHKTGFASGGLYPPQSASGGPLMADRGNSY